MGSRYFVTGTDTGVGKTYASCALMAAARAAGKTTLGLKPVAAGSEMMDGKLVNEDAIALMEHSSVKLDYAQVNPVLLDAATSPHIAAHLEQRNVSVARLLGFCRGALMNKSDFALVEGAGGWRVPVNKRETLADLAKQLEFPVIVVVALRLGCLNHAALTVEAIQRDGLKVAGWVANRVQAEPMDYEQEYLATLKSSMPAPLIANLAYRKSKTVSDLVTEIDLECLKL